MIDVSISTLDKLSTTVTSSDLTMNYLSFEKDDDTNGHIDFITAASVKMYTVTLAIFHLFFAEFTSHHVQH